MNSSAIVTRDTSVEYINEIALNNIVMQGAIMGPILCIIETDEISIGDNIEHK